MFSEDIINSDHKLINFQINLQVPKRNPSLKRSVYKFKCADWNGIKQTLTNIPWDLCFVQDDADEWTDMFLVAVDQDILKCRARNINDHPWIDSELRYLIKSKDKQRRKAMKTKKSDDWDKF